MTADPHPPSRSSSRALALRRGLVTCSLTILMLGLSQAPAAHGAAAIHSPPAASTGHDTVYLYGDSLLWEMQSQLQFQLGLDGVASVVKAVGGAALCDSIAPIEADVRAAHPATVVVVFSGNALTSCMSGVDTDAALLSRYRADLDHLASWLHSAGIPLMVVGAPPAIERTNGPVVIPTTWSVGQIPGGYQAAQPALDEMYRAAVAGYRADGWAVDYIGAGSALAAPDGDWTYVLPCMYFETSAMGCNSQGLIKVRAADFAHLCPATSTASADPGWCGGAWRYAAAVSGRLSPRMPAAEGYWMAATDGGVFTFGAGSQFYGSAVGEQLRGPVVGMARDPATGGYWLVTSDGNVIAFHAPSYGSAANWTLAQPVVGMAAAPDGLGYWLVARDGGLFSFGSSARYYGSASGLAAASPIVGMAADPATGGYWLVGSDGRIFAFHAPFLGSTAGMRLDKPIVGMAADPATGGYWLVASDGGIFAFHAPFLGSTGGIRLTQPVVGFAGSP